MTRYADLIHPGRAAALAVALGGLFAGQGAQAYTSVYATSNVCRGETYQSDCLSPPIGYSGAVGIWSPGGGEASSSVSHGWSYVANGGSADSNYNVVAAAQASVDGVNQWKLYSSATGDMNAQFYGTNNVSATAEAKVADSIDFTNSQGWSGYGTFKMFFQVDGSASVAYAVAGDPLASSANGAGGSLSFNCASSSGGGGSGIGCTSPNVPGANTYLGFSFAGSQTFDKIVELDFTVEQGVVNQFVIDSIASSGMNVQATQNHVLVSGGATLAFDHTVTLVDAQLVDGAGHAVAGWTGIGESGFDYAHIAAVPEPGETALWLGGLAALGAVRRRRRAGTAADQCR